MKLRLPSLILLSALLMGAKKAPPPPPPAEPPPPPPPADILGPRPEVGPEVNVTVPTPETATLSNGAGVWVVPAPSLPLVSITLSVPGGSSADAAGREGTAALSDRLMSQGAGDRDAAAFALAVEQLGIQLDVSSGRTVSTVSMSFTKDKMGAALDLLADMVLRARYGKGDYTREKGILLSDLQASQDEPVAVATKLGWSLWFGAEHPYAKPPDGTVAGMKKVSFKDVKAYHRAAWVGGGAEFTVAGAVSKDEVVAALEPRLGAPWKAGTPLVVPSGKVAAHADAPIYLVDKPGSAQTMFYLVFDGPAFGTPEVPPVRGGTVVLGGTFTSRLNALLREKKGYTYGARARLEALPGAGVRVVSSRIRTDVTAPAMTDIVGELAAIRAGVTAEEVTKARAAYRQDMVEAMESRDGLAATFAQWQRAGLAPDALAKELAAMNGLTPEGVKAAMSAYDPSKAVIVLVGDKAVIEKPLAEAGFTKIQVVEPL